MRTRIMIAAALAALASAAVAGTASVTAQDGGERPSFVLGLVDGTGQAVGTVEVVPTGRALDITVRTRRGLRTGFHGFHMHAVGRCDGPSFASAGPHFERAGQDHGGHAGDLPTVLVKANGTAYLRVTTDLITRDEMLDEDGSAFIVHAGRDNQANIPPRYGTPDQETQNTGDSGGRAACAAVVPPSISGSAGG